MGTSVSRLRALCCSRGSRWSGSRRRRSARSEVRDDLLDCIEIRLRGHIRGHHADGGEHRLERFERVGTEFPRMAHRSPIRADCGRVIDITRPERCAQSGEGVRGTGERHGERARAAKIKTER